MYHIVVFEATNEVELVPSTWVRDGQCFWPPNTVDIVKSTKAQDSPGDGWTPYSVKVIFTSDDYNEARLKLPEAVVNTDLDTDGEDSPVKYKRRRRQKPVCLPGEEDDMEEPLPKVKGRNKLGLLPTAPKILHSLGSKGIVSSKAKSRQGSASPYQIPRRQKHVHRHASKDQAHRGVFQEQGHSFSPDHDHRASMSPDQAHRDDQHQRGHVSSSANQQQCDLFISLLRAILTNQEIMLEQMKSIFKTVQGLKSIAEEETGIEQDLLPVADVHALENLEERLGNNDFKNQLIHYLALKGGSNVRESVWRIMNALITNTLAKSINMRGINGKIGFQRLMLKEVVIAAVRKNSLTRTATDQEAEKDIQKWLQLAPDRDGGRKERARRANET
ncbi:uncharacterized protein [Paramormyrops kingsleyae]|uniref:uncharacterized protein n=1 Tax=Paramormyrops kingsleyae TaxID=1676925 RepID=UPI003B972A60